MALVARQLRACSASLRMHLNQCSRSSSTAPAVTQTETEPKMTNSKFKNIMNTWEPTDDPILAKKRLTRLRKDYELQVKELRKKYYGQYQTVVAKKKQRAEEYRQRVIAARQQREAAKKQRSEMLALERKQEREEFRQMLLKRKVEKAQMRLRNEQLLEQKKVQEEAEIRQRSSVWIDEKDLENKIIESLVQHLDL